MFLTVYSTRCIRIRCKTLNSSVTSCFFTKAGFQRGSYLKYIFFILSDITVYITVHTGT